MLFEIIGTGLSTGARNMVSPYFGSGQLNQANRIFSTSVILAIIMNKAKSVQYTTTFGANNLIIRI